MLLELIASEINVRYLGTIFLIGSDVAKVTYCREMVLFFLSYDLQR